MTLRHPVDKNKDAPLLPGLNRNAASTRPVILVVEDDADVRKMLEIALLSFDFLVHPAATCTEAQETLRREKCDVILMDIQMSGTDGLETWTILKSIDPAVRCCFISGYAGKYTYEDMVGAGADGFLQKPFQLEELCKLILDSIGKSHVH